MCHMFAHIVCSMRPKDRTLSGATTPGQSELGTNGNEAVLHIPQISKARAWPSDGLMSYPEHSLVGSYTSSEIKSVYSTVPADLADQVSLKPRLWLVDVS